MATKPRIDQDALTVMSALNENSNPDNEGWMSFDELHKSVRVVRISHTLDALKNRGFAEWRGSYASSFHRDWRLTEVGVDYLVMR